MSSRIIRGRGAAQPWEIVPIQPSAPHAACDRAGGPPRALVGTSPAEVQAEEILAAARRQAEELIEAARQEAARIRVAALREGSADGRAEALEAWAEERGRLRGLTGGIGDAYRRFCEAQVPELAALAVTAAERLFGEQLALEPGRVAAVVSEAVARLNGSGRIVVHLHPEDVERVRPTLAEMERRQSFELRIVPDPSVEPGGCWLESDQGDVDATVSGRTGRLRQALEAAE